MTPHPPAELTGDVRLRNVAPGDLLIFFEQQCDPLAIRMAAFAARNREAFMAHWTNLLADPTVPARTILLDGEVAGNIVSWEREGERLVGYWVGRRYWGKGVATRALHAFLEVVQVRPLHSRVAKTNVGSIRVLEKCGFTACLEEIQALGSPADRVEELVFELGTSGSDERR